MPVVNTRVINGVVRTSEPVWSNLERMAEALTSWFTYDVHTGLYSWVINESGNVVTGGALTEADIIGPLQISGSGLTNLYNAVEIEYPNTDIRDQPHYVRIDLPAGIRNAYEPDNTLQITSEFINNQPQAMAMADVTLRQTRLDRTVTFNADYTKINLRAGDIISITSDTYGWAAKEFRIMRVREVEGDNGALRLEFSCTEYDDGIYEGDISEFLVGGPPGIISLGSIGVPGTPTIVQTNYQSLPAMQVTSTVPTGVVDRMQFWAGNVDITGNVANTEFNLVGTVASTDANAFTANANVVFNSTNLRTGTWAWKTRGVNYSGTGPFSDISANVDWVRVQAPDAISNTTPIIDSNGNVLSNSIVGYLEQASNFASLLYFSQSDPEFYDTANNAVQFSSNVAGTTIYQGWRKTEDITFTGPGNSTYIIDVELNGAALDTWYANNFPYTRYAGISVGTSVDREAYAVTTEYNDALGDVHLTAYINSASNVENTKSVRITTSVESVVGNVLGGQTTIKIWRKPGETL